MIRLWQSTLVAVVLVLALALPAWTQERRIALILGNDGYKTLPKLHNAAADARAIDAKLGPLDRGLEDGVDGDDRLAGLVVTGDDAARGFGHGRSSRSRT